MFNFFGKKSPQKPQSADNQLITADMTINEIISKYPIAVKVFAKYGITCAGCNMGHHESLKEGIAGHGIPLGPVLSDLNRFAAESTKQ